MTWNVSIAPYTSSDAKPDVPQGNMRSVSSCFCTLQLISLSPPIPIKAIDFLLSLLGRRHSLFRLSPYKLKRKTALPNARGHSAHSATQATMSFLPNQQQQQQQQQPDNPIIVELLLPHRYCTWNEHPNVLAGMPLKNRPLLERPFPLPLPDLGGRGNIGRPGEVPVYPPPLRFNTLSRMRVSTKETSRTKITEGMTNAPHHARLHQIRVSNELWTALVGFAVGPGDIPPVGLNAAIPQPYLASFRQHHFNPQQPIWLGLQQRRGIRALWWWFLMHNNTLHPLVNSELSVQDEIQRQLLYPIDQLILVQYNQSRILPIF